MTRIPVSKQVLGLLGWLMLTFAAAAALSLFLVQLAANALWTWLFFAWQQGAFAFAEILILWTLLLCTVIAFWRVRPLAGALLFPYLAWVTFASALTFATWQLNPQIFT